MPPFDGTGNVCKLLGYMRKTRRKPPNIEMVDERENAKSRQYAPWHVCAYGGGAYVNKPSERIINVKDGNNNKWTGTTRKKTQPDISRSIPITNSSTFSLPCNYGPNNYIVYVRFYDRFSILARCKVEVYVDIDSTAYITCIVCIDVIQLNCVRSLAHSFLRWPPIPSKQPLIQRNPQCHSPHVIHGCIAPDKKRKLFKQTQQIAT